ncbi:DUF485 domain-containing protein [Leucobacter luti]|nr:DUF485 domain-containing protein [Leucobacter luti]
MVSYPKDIGPAATPDLEEFVRRNHRVRFGLAAIVLGFFLPLPILGGFTPALDAHIGLGITVAWVYAFAQFVLALVVAQYYMRRARRSDAAGERLIEREGETWTP